MHPIALLHKIFSEEHTLESYSNEIEQCYNHAPHDKASGMYYNSSPLSQNYPPMFEHGFLPLIMYLCTPPPPPITIGYVIM